VSEPVNPGFPQSKRSLGCVFKVAIAFIILFFAFMFLAAGIGSGAIEALIALTFGWLGFLKRTGPEIAWNWDLAVMAVLCAGMIALLGQTLASWVTKHIAAKHDTMRQWPWRWTWCGLIGLGLLFLVGMSVGGAAHQIGWIAGSEEPWFERKPRYLEERMQMRELDVEFRIALAETNTFGGVRQSFRDSDVERRLFERRKQSSLYSFHILLVSTNGERVDGIILFPRDPEIKSRLNGYFITDADSAPIPAQQIPELLKERAPFLISF
jgi:hypothetical protein